ncbi:MULTISPECIES: ester cyclase [Haloferax]|uniref:ester cyclase n=1 Tax=Haloferax TaxID=2251 RepID=UPI0012AFD2A4|nr:ester cyclase [Haloferax marinum]
MSTILVRSYDTNRTRDRTTRKRVREHIERTRVREDTGPRLGIVLDIRPCCPWGVVHGRDGLEQFIRAAVSGGPDFHVTILDMLSTEDRAMYGGQMSMTHQREFTGIPPTGQEVEARYMGKIDIVDGKVQEHRLYFNQLKFLEQFGPTDT